VRLKNLSQYCLSTLAFSGAALTRLALQNSVSKRGVSILAFALLALDFPSQTPDSAES
jgi:hypothetical protein